MYFLSFGLQSTLHRFSSLLNDAHPNFLSVSYRSTPTTIVPSLLGVTFAGASNDDILVFAMNVPPPLVRI